MTSPKVTPAERIRELSAINAEVAGMLQSAGHAINALTNRPLQSQEDVDVEMNDSTEQNDTDKRKEAFTRHTEAYYTALQSVVARLRRQAYALEEAGIIAPEAPLTTTTSAPPQKSSVPGTASGAVRGQSGAPPQQTAERAAHVSLDVGWLNSRGNRVGLEKDAELIEEAKSLVENVLNRE